MLTTIRQTDPEERRAARLAGAEADCRRTLARDPNDPEALHRLGALAYAARRYDEARDLLGRSLRLRPDRAEAHNDLGAVLEVHGDAGEAIASYERRQPALWRGEEGT